MAKQILVLGDKSYNSPFVDHGEVVNVNPQLVDPNYAAQFDLVVFTGGPDVPPSAYGDQIHPTTMPHSVRFNTESEVFDICQLSGVRMTGICYGSQVLCVLNGGKMIQDVSNHAIGGTHTIKLWDGREIQVTSTHHQMVYPFNMDKRDYEILGWADGLSMRYEIGGGDDETQAYFQRVPPRRVEPDIVWYPNTKSLGVQYHPEYMNKDTDGWWLYQELLKRYVL